MLETKARALGLAERLDIMQTLHREARLLDEERFAEWLEMTSDDVVYRMALRSRRFRGDRSPPRPVGAGFIFNEDRRRLQLRVDRLCSGLVWAEDPPNFIRRTIANIEIYPAQSDAEAEVHSTVVIHRNRIDGQSRMLTGGRRDLWRSEGGAWRLAARDVVLDHAVVPDSNLNLFF